MLIDGIFVYFYLCFNIWHFDVEEVFNIKVVSTVLLCLIRSWLQSFTLKFYWHPKKVFLFGVYKQVNFITQLPHVIPVALLIRIQPFMICWVLNGHKSQFLTCSVGKGGSIYCHTRLHLDFSAKLRIWQVSTCKMEPRSGTIITDWASQPSTYFDTLALSMLCGVPTPIVLELCAVSPP